MGKFISTCFFFLSSLTVQASDFSLFAGWTDVNSLATIAGEVSFNNFNVFGVRWEKDFFVVLGFENTLAFSPRSVLTTAGEDDAGLYSNHNLVVNLPVRRILPYLTVGFGVLHKFGDSLPDVNSSFTLNWGTGVKWRRILGAVGLRVDYRRFTIYGGLDENVKTNELSAGMMFSY